MNQFVSQNDEVRDFLKTVLLEDVMYFDWQRMWVLATLLHSDEGSDEVVRRTLDLVRRSSCHDTLRAVAAIIVGKFGSYARRRSLIAES